MPAERSVNINPSTLKVAEKKPVSGVMKPAQAEPRTRAEFTTPTRSQEPGEPIVLSEAEARANRAASIVISAIENSTVENVHAIFEQEADQKDVLQKAEQLGQDEDFRDRLASAYLAWAAKTHVILPNEDESKASEKPQKKDQ